VSGNEKDFGDSQGGLKAELRREFRQHDPVTYVPSISGLLPLLAEQGGAPFTVPQLESVRGLKRYMQSRLNEDVLRIDLLNRLVESAFSARLRWTGVATNVQEPFLIEIRSQKVYRLKSKQEVAVVRTQWGAFVDVELSGPSNLIAAGFTKGLTAILANLEIWAKRDPSGEVEYSLSGSDEVEVAPQASEVFRQ